MSAQKIGTNGVGGPTWMFKYKNVTMQQIWPSKMAPVAKSAISNSFDLQRVDNNSQFLQQAVNG